MQVPCPPCPSVSTLALWLPIIVNVALAAIALSEGRLFPSCDSSGFERAMDAPLRQVLVTGVGHWRGEGLALVETVGNAG